jgi:hypothetical protein
MSKEIALRNPDIDPTDEVQDYRRSNQNHHSIKEKCTQTTTMA